MTALRHILDSAWTRVGLGLAAMGSIVIGLPQPAGSTFDIEKFIPIVSAVGLWLWAEINHGRAPHPNDLALFEKFGQTVKKNERLELSEQDMGAPFRFKTFDGTFVIRETWKGPSFKFQDKKLQELWEIVSADVERFCSLVVMNTGAMPGNQEVATVKTTEDLHRGTRSPQTIQNAKDLNDAASSLCKSYDSLEAAAIRRLNISA
jgi:hypothetical protein